jgi:hypothetical protein
MVGDLLGQVETQPPADTRLHGAWLAAARVAWASAAILTLGLFIASLAPYYHDLVTFSIGQINSPALVRDGLSQLGLSQGVYAASILAARIVFTITYVGVALLIFARRSDDRVALLFSFTLIASGVVLGTTIESLPRNYPALRITVDLLKLYGASAFFLFCYLFPDGRFVPGWTRIAAICFVVIQIAQIFLRDSPFDPNSWPLAVRLALYGVLLGSCLFAPIYRYRRVSDRPQRQQIKWAVFGFTIAIAGTIGLIAVLMVYYLFVPDGLAGIAGALIEMIGVALYLFFLLAVPVTVAIAILRYRLWDIDILIRRTLIYGALTAALALVYVTSVVLFQTAFRTLTSEGRSELATVASTLLSAALFAPLRQHLQTAIDRRFYRRKYNAARTLADFSAQMRDEVDLDRLSQALQAAVGETIQPASIGLWLRDQAGGRSERER